jgi:hypothetical protein
LPVLDCRAQAANRRAQRYIFRAQPRKMAIPKYSPIFA